MGKRRRMTRAQLRMKCYDTTKRLDVVWSNKRMIPPYPLFAPPPYAASNPYCFANSAPPAPGRSFSAPPFFHPADVNSLDMNGIICDDDIPAAITQEEEDDPTSLDNKRLIANSVPSTELEVALAAELDKKVKHNEHLSAELDKLRHVLSRIQAHQSNEPLPPPGSALPTRKDHRQHKPPQTTKKGRRNGYNMFYSKIAPELKGTLNSYKELAKVISEKWKALSKEEKENYEFDAEIFNIMDERDQRDSHEDEQHQDEERDQQCDSYDEDDQHQHYPTAIAYQYHYDMTIPPPPGPPPPGLFDLYAPGSFPPPPPPPPGYDYTFPGYDYTFPPPPPNDIFGAGLPPPPPPPIFTEMNLPPTHSDKNQASQSPLNFKLYDPPPPMYRSQSN